MYRLQTLHLYVVMEMEEKIPSQESIGIKYIDFFNGIYILNEIFLMVWNILYVVKERNFVIFFR